MQIVDTTTMETETSTDVTMTVEGGESSSTKQMSHVKQETTEQTSSGKHTTEPTLCCLIIYHFSIMIIQTMQ